jgi:hypothetical protein
MLFSGIFSKNESEIWRTGFRYLVLSDDDKTDTSHERRILDYDRDCLHHRYHLYRL